MSAPKYIARALGNALSPQARKANDYLGEWETLARAGVPAEHARAVLDQKRQETSSTVAVARWDGRGWLGLCGDYGPGKTFAAACWLLEQSRRGKSVFWFSAVDWSTLDLKAQAALVRRATASGALVVDDIGAGVTRRKAAGKQDWFAQQLEGLLMARASAPTITASNEDAAEVADWLGQRLLDRLRVCGDLVQIRGPSMREDKPDPHDDEGRSPRWHRARKLVDQLGIRWASVWTEGRDVAHVVVGEKLELRTDARYRASQEPEAEARDHALVEPLELAGRYKLDLGEINATARELEANDPAKLLATAYETLVQDTPMNRAKARFSDSIAADNERRSRVCYETLREMTGRLRGEADPSTVAMGKPPEWTKGPKGFKAMQALGYWLRPLGGGSRGYEIVRRVKGRPDQMVIPEHDTDVEAWEALRRLMAVPVDDDPAATAAAVARARGTA